VKLRSSLRKMNPFPLDGRVIRGKLGEARGSVRVADLAAGLISARARKLLSVERDLVPSPLVGEGQGGG
jgi:hypothetical protein